MEVEKAGKPVWGVVATAVCWHLFPDCPRIDDKPIYRAINKPVAYESPEAAMKAGHLRCCEDCKRGRLVQYEDGLYMRLTVEQIDTLRAIGRVHAKTNSPLSLAQIAEARGRKTSTCFVLVKALVGKGLVAKKYGRRGSKAVNSSIVPTPLAAKVLAKLS